MPFSDGGQADALVASSFAGALSRGNRCLLVSTRSPSILVSLHQLGVSVQGQIDRGALLVLDPDVFYQSQGGSRPSVEASLAGVQHASEEARRAGFNGLHGAGGPWCYDNYDDEEWHRHVAYESEVNAVMRRCGATGLCLYERPKAPARCLQVMLRTHPHVYVDGALVANPLCDPAMTSQADRASQAQIEWILHQLSHGKRDSERHNDNSAPDVGDDQDSSSSLGVQAERARRSAGERGRQADEIESRNAFIRSFSRQLRMPYEQLDGLLREAGESGPPAGGDWLDRLRDVAEGVGRICRHLDAASADLGEATPSVLALAELGQVTSHTLEDWMHRQHGCRPNVQLQIKGPAAGLWEITRLEVIVSAILDATWERGWGTRIELIVEDLGSRARLTATYGDMEVRAGYPLEPGLQERLLVSARDSLRLSLWVARENARVLGGTLGLSVWPDARVSVTLDLPKKAAV